MAGSDTMVIAVIDPDPDLLLLDPLGHDPDCVLADE